MSDRKMAQASKSIFRSMLVNTGGILASRVFGLARDMLMAFYWGSTEVFQAAYNTAFAIPNTFRALFAEGAFSAAFVPMISRKLAEGDKENAWKLACRTISLQIVLLLVSIVIVCGISGGVLLLLGDRTTELNRTIFQILPLLMPYALFICVTGAFAAILNSLRHFAIPALTPVIFNIVQIFAIVALYFCGKTRHEFSSLLWFCGAILLAGVLQMLALLWTCRQKGFRFHFDCHWRDPDVKQLIGKIVPGLIGAGAHQLNVVIDKALAVLVGAAAVGAINYSNRLIFLPVGIFGAAMGVACLPNMARASQEEMADCLDSALRQVLFLALPCTALCFALTTPIISLLFQRGAFTEESVQECAQALLFYLPGLPAFCCLKVAVTTHHGRQDTATPVKISMICMALNVILNIALMKTLRQGGLALASSISSWINVILLLLIDVKKLPNWQYGKTLIAMLRLMVASALCAGAAWAISVVLRPILPNGTMLRALVTVVSGTIAGCVVYLIACKLLHQREWAELLGAIRRRKAK